jgi:hypothetical protein
MRGRAKVLKKYFKAFATGSKKCPNTEVLMVELIRTDS